MSTVQFLDTGCQSPVEKLIHFSRGFFVALVIFSPVLLIHCGQLLALIFMPFRPDWFRAINRFIANYYWALLVFVLERVNRIRVEIQGDEVPEAENAVVDCNHQNVGDIPALMALAWRKKRLGDLKFFVKDVVKYLPGPGWGMLLLDCIFVKRNWMSDKINIERTFRKFKRNKTPLWIVSFLEGTRITPAKLEKSQQFMRKKGLVVTQNVMAPRTKGFIATVESLREELDAVYNVTLFYPDGVPSLWQMLKADCTRVVLHVKRTAIQDLPTDPEALSQWVIQAYVEKDRWLEQQKHQRLPLAGQYVPASS